MAARWPRAKFAEEPHSLHPVTGTWSRAPEQRRVFSLICVRTNAQAFGTAPSLNASPVDSQLWKLKFRVSQYCQRLDQLCCKYWGFGEPRRVRKEDIEYSEDGGASLRRGQALYIQTERGHC